jgi:hypothetical protein
MKNRSTRVVPGLPWLSSAYRLVSGTQTWIPAADGLPMVAVSGLTLANSTRGDDRLLYAATHGRGAYRLRLR